MFNVFKIVQNTINLSTICLLCSCVLQVATVNKTDCKVKEIFLLRRGLFEQNHAVVIVFLLLFRSNLIRP